MDARRAGISAGIVVAAMLIVSSCGVGETGPADQITDHRARLTGRVGNVDPGATSYHFEYGLTDAYGSSTPGGTANVVDASSPWTVAEVVGDLQPGTEYHYRLCAADAAGFGTCGQDATFTTNTGHDSVIGSGVVLNPYPGPFVAGTIYTWINAVADVDGSGPVGSALHSAPQATGTVFEVRGDITCLRVEGTRATIGYPGTIDGIPIFAPTVMFVQDGASTATPDRFAYRTVEQVPTSCPAPNEADFPAPVPGGNVLLSGDFEVHDGS